MNDEVLALLAANAAAGRPCALATVVRTESPTSAHPGDAAVITADGRLHGWVGGSCSDPLVRREALRALADGLPRLVRIVPSATVEERREEGELTVATTCPSGGALDIFVDPQLPRALLVVVGDSPAARMLVQLGGVSGFRTCAVHPGAVAADFPGASRVLSSLDDVGTLAGAPDVWVVVATMGHYDEEGLEAVLGLPLADVALVASERRAAAVVAGLRARGVDEAQIARVRTPAGAHRGGTQEEIALHALDDVVVRRREGLARLRVAAGASPSQGDLGRALEGSAPQGDSTRGLELAFATDPVCGMTVDVATSMHRVEHGGATYHFCCAGCARQFEAQPSRFLTAGTA
ncbi:MAG TPA: XdhC family protein [Candidatus Angelobacter sp.]|jgi:xanthine dehydrogenase accessory factor|nr:XdhC family protein [Candidatus Angelobacter sp.]